MLLLTLDLSLLVLFALGYAAAYIPPRSLWWLQVVATVLPYLSAALFGVALMVWMAGAWKLLALHGLCLLLVLLRFIPFERFEHRSGTEAEALVLMTYNAKYQYPAGEAQEGDALKALVGQEQPHLVAFQETIVHYLDQFSRYSGHPHISALFSLGYDTTWPLPGPGKLYSEAVLGRVEMGPQTLVTMPGEAIPFGVRASMQWEGREVVLYNLYLRSFHVKEEPADDDGAKSTWLEKIRMLRQAYQERADQARYLRRRLDQETLPVLVCGDFNSTPDNWTYRHIARGLQDAFRKAGRGWGGTYHARFPFVRIDHVLASNAWEVQESHVAQATFSDHLPLVAKLSLRPAAGTP